METARHIGQKVAMGHGVPSGVRRQGIGSIGNERHLRRDHLTDQGDEIGDRISLDVELRAEYPLEVPHIVVADVPSVGTRMHRNAVGAEALDVRGRADHVGKIAAARVAHDGNLIDVYTQLCHKIRYICIREPPAAAPDEAGMRTAPSPMLNQVARAIRTRHEPASCIVLAW